MTSRSYRMTPTAEAHFWQALRDTKEKWGKQKAEKYRVKFLAELQNLADNHPFTPTAHRKKLAAGTTFSLHLIEHRYVVFQECDKNTLIIVGIFHESMDIPARLRELQGLASREIDAIKACL